jgi:ABC-2 type transport system permease protein
MTAAAITTATPLAAAIRRPPPPSPGQVFRAVARAEWTKMRSVRSTMWTLVVMVGLAVGFAALVGVSQVNS